MCKGIILHMLIQAVEATCMTGVSRRARPKQSRPSAVHGAGCFRGGEPSAYDEYESCDPISYRATIRSGSVPRWT
jgi:hypothetical protein